MAVWRFGPSGMEDADETEFLANEDPETEEDRLESDGVADSPRACARWPLEDAGERIGAAGSLSDTVGTSGNSREVLGETLEPDPAAFAIAKSPLTKSLPCESTLEDDEEPIINGGASRFTIEFHSDLRPLSSSSCAASWVRRSRQMASLAAIFCRSSACLYSA